VNTAKNTVRNVNKPVSQRKNRRKNLKKQFFFQTSLDIISFLWYNMQQSNRTGSTEEYFMSKARLTIRDIAKLAGVAPSTVSEVINGNRKKRVRSQTEAMIREVIEKYNYVSLPAARALSTQKTKHIGFLVSSKATLGIANAFFAEILAGVEEICTARNYHCTVGKYDFSPDVHNFVLSPELRQRSVDALIVTGSNSEKCLQALISLGIPVIVLSCAEVPKPLFSINWEKSANSIVAMKHLYELGHRKILIPYYYEINLKHFQLHVQKFNTTVDEKIDPNFIQYTEDDFVAGKEFARKVFSAGELSGCTAIYANDQICCGFLQQMFQLNKKCPDDFSILSHSNTQLCQWNTIPISANEGITYETGKLAANSVIDLLENIKTEDQIREILSSTIQTSEVIKRTSTGLVPQNTII
jgi:DNA-binding LacI/PurR family transcriptional regulator